MRRMQNWSNEQDEFLMKYYKEADCFQRWKYISYKLKEIGIIKTELQCRDRYFNHVDPTLKHQKLTIIQINKLFQYYDLYGPKWSFFQSKLHGRSQAQLKNKFHSINRSFIRQFVKFMNKKKIKKVKIPSANLSSKLITDIYQGRKKYSRFKDLMRNSLKYLNYEINEQITQSYFTSLSFSILQSLYLTIYQDLIIKTERQNNNYHINHMNIINYQNYYQQQQYPTLPSQQEGYVKDQCASIGKGLSSKIDASNNYNCNIIMAMPFTCGLPNFNFYFCGS